MKRLIHIRRGDLVPKDSKLIQAGVKKTKEQPSYGGYKIVTWDLWEVYE